jgi:sulfoxide reductase catalytic subunit YedY
MLNDKILRAYGLNGEMLPRKHGFPLRLVAGEDYGSVWVKYVDQVVFERL